MTKKIILILAIMILIMCSTNALQVKAISNIIQGGQNFIESGNDGKGISFDNSKLKEMSDFVYNVLLAIGIVTAVIIGTVLGIQFVTGSVEQKAKIKDALIPFVVGCVVIFGAFGIWKIVVNIGASMQ